MKLQKAPVVIIGSLTKAYQWLLALQKCVVLHFSGSSGLKEFLQLDLSAVLAFSSCDDFLVATSLMHETQTCS